MPLTPLVLLLSALLGLAAGASSVLLQTAPGATTNPEEVALITAIAGIAVALIGAIALVGNARASAANAARIAAQPPVPVQPAAPPPEPPGYEVRYRRLEARLEALERAVDIVAPPAMADQIRQAAQRAYRWRPLNDD